jgi:hypothetical protein
MMDVSKVGTPPVSSEMPRFTIKNADPIIVHHVEKKIKPATHYQLITHLLTSADVADVQNATQS